MTDHDTLFKRLLMAFLGEFLRLFLPEVAAYTDLRQVTFLDKELPHTQPKAKKRAADLVARVRWHDQPAFFLFHIEAQAKKQDHFHERMFQYFARLYEKYKLPVYPIALLTFDSPRKAQPEALQITFPDLQVLDFRFRVIQLNQLSWRDFINHPNPLASALMAKMRIDKKDRPRVKAECLRMLLTMRLDEEKQGLIWEFVDTYLQLTATEEKTFQKELATIAPDVEAEAMELMTSWERRGWKRGRQEEAQTLVVRLLQHKFGVLPDALQTRLGMLTHPKLENLSVALLDFRKFDEITTWLEKHAPQKAA